MKMIMGMKIKIESGHEDGNGYGNKNANATKTPYKAPDAPTITPLNAERAEIRLSLPTLFIYENDKSPDIKKLSISLFVKPSPDNIE